MIQKDESDIVWAPETIGMKFFCWYARHLPDHWAKVRILKHLTRWLCPMGAWLRLGKSARFLADPGDYIGWQILCVGNFEPRSLSLAVRLMKDSDDRVFLDVGANQGLYTAVVGKGTPCQVVAVEAAPQAFVHLQKVVSGNGAINVRLVHACVASHAGMVEFGVPQEGCGAWGAVVTEPGRTGDAETLRFSCLTEKIETLLSAFETKGVHLMKIDVEGFEVEVFKGMNWQGRHRPRHIIAECSPAETAKLNFLCERGYTPLTVEGKALDARDSWPEGNLWFRDITQ